MSIAVFASGSGSNFEALVQHSQLQSWPTTISMLIVDRPGAKAIERAKRLQIPVHVLSPKDFSTKEDYEAAILRLLNENQIEWIVLAGYLRIIGSTLLDCYEGRIVNIHPSLLPAFPGLRAIQQAWEYGVKVTGVTVHFVDAGLDTGPIIAQKVVSIEETDTLSSLTEKVHAVEHELYAACVYQVITGQIQFHSSNHGEK